MAVSPNGKSLYVAGSFSNAIAVFARDKKTGALTQLAAPYGCVANVGDGLTCQDGLGLGSPFAATVSPDNKNVYVGTGGGIAVFNRDLGTGALTQLPAPDGCILEFGGEPTGCTDAYGALAATDVLVSPDGKFVYALALNTDTIGVFARDKATGKLTQLPAPEGCISATGDGVTCTAAIGLDAPMAVLVGKNDKHVYVASSACSPQRLSSASATRR